MKKPIKILGTMALLILVMAIGTQESNAATNKSKKGGKVSKSVLAGKTFQGNDTYAQFQIKFINKTQCAYSFMYEPPASCQKGTYVIKDDKTVVCTFAGIVYTDLDCKNPWPSFNDDGEEIPPEEQDPEEWTLTSTDNFKTLQTNQFGLEWNLWTDD